MQTLNSPEGVDRRPPMPAPAPAAPLLGRDAELLQLEHLLTSGETRLVTLTGAGGSGKSRLTLELASELTPRFEDVWFVDLSTVGSADQVPVAIAEAIGLHAADDEPLQAIVQALSSRRSLLVLDNFENVLNAAGLVAELLARCASLHVLVTSRESLQIRAERVFVVEPLAVPDPERALTAASIRDVPAVLLFEDRARARRPNFEVTDSSARAVAEICVRLDGLPLAIELAASQIGSLTPETILSRLYRRAPFLGGGPRDLPARHQTLQAAVAGSYGLLSTVERTVFRACGVFVGSFSAQAVQSVLDGEADNVDVDVLDILAQLVGKSLLRTADDSGNGARFSLLETIREYALDQLEESGDMPRFRARHAKFYVELVERLQPSLRGPGMAATLRELATEYPNIRLVFEWATDVGDPATGLRLAGALYRFWTARGHLREARAWLENALAASGPVPPYIRALALNAAGVMAGIQHDHDKAVAFLSESLYLWRELGDAASQATAYLNLGMVAWSRRRPDEARGLFQRAQALFVASGNRAGEARTLGSHALVARDQDDLEGARRLLREALELFRAERDDFGTANTLANLGSVALALGDRTGAASAFSEALELRRALGNVVHIAECFEGLAAVAADSQPRRAARLLGAAEALHDTSGAPMEAVDQKRQADLVARLRARLRPDTFARAWQQGRKSSLDETMDFAAQDPLLRSADGEDVSNSQAARLSAREREIARLIARGKSNRDIAKSLVLSVNTIETHIKHVFRKLQVGSRAEIATWATKQGLI